MYLSFFSNSSLLVLLAGNYAQYAAENLHNSFLSLCALFGIPGAWLYFRFLRQALRYYRRQLTGRASYMAYAGLLAIIAHGVAEGTLLVAGAVYTGLGGLLLVLMLPENEDGKL